MEGYGHVLDTPRLRLALLRDDLERAERDRGRPAAGSRLAPRLAPALDPLAPGSTRSPRLGHRDELEAWQPPRAGTYLEPFYLRALGVVREDERLLERSLAAFEALRLEHHAAETRAVLA